MQPATQVTLAQLEQVEWFHAVGQEIDSPVIRVSSWKEAIETCSSLDWENLCLEIVNRYCNKLRLVNHQRYAQWNLVVGEIRKLALPLVSRKTAVVTMRYRLPKVFEDTVQWDIIHFLTETEYSDVVPQGFYSAQAYFYSIGHFPCGWNGDFLGGKLIVF